MSFNAKITNFIALINKNINLNNSMINIVLDRNVLTRVQSTIFLGIYVDDGLCWRQHIRAVYSAKNSRSICILCKIRYKLPVYVLRNLYFTLIQPLLLY